MRRRWLTLVLVTLAAPVLLAVGSLTATEEQTMPEEIRINNEGYRHDKKGPVWFTHLVHAEDYGFDCRECHHDYQDGKNVWEDGDPVEGCVSCHDPRLSDGNMRRLQSAYHGNCRRCHREMAKRGESEDAPYGRCYLCHEKGS